MKRSSAQLLFLFALAGCEPAPSTPIDSHEVDVHEIELVHPEVGFSDVRDIVARGEDLWVLDGAPPFLTRFAIRGSTVVRVGGRGGGPSEFMNPWAMNADGQGVRVWDLGNRRVSVVSGDGVATSSARISDAAGSRLRANFRDVSYVDPFRIRAWEGGIVFSHYRGSVDRTADIAAGSLQWANERLEPVGKIFAYADHMNARSGLHEWAALPFWDVCDDVGVVWSPGEAALLWMDAQGQVLDRTALELEPPRITVSDVEAYLRWMGRLELGPEYQEGGIDYSAMAARNKARFAKEAPIATDLRCESEQVAWVRLFDTARDPLGRGRAWLRVERSGAVVEIRFPAEFTPILFRGRGVFGVLPHSDGQQQLGRWVGVEGSA